MKYKILTIALFSAFTVQADSLSAKRLPADLLYMGKPIDADCFAGLNNPANTIKLPNCGAIPAKLSVKKEQNGYLIKKGFIGYDWIDADQSNGFSYYQAFPAYDKKFWIYTLHNGGGTGTFSSIYLLTRIDNDTVEMKNVVAGGDRCNGGIEEVDLKGSKLHYSISLTAADVLAMVKENPKIKAYDDISACASCCFATAVYEIEETSSKLQYVDFGTNSNAGEMPEQGTYQKCFNNLFASYVAKGKNKLDKVALSQFTDEFERKCLK